MATAVLPLYLGSLGLGATALGVIEGVADFVSGTSKLAGGMAGQRMRRKKPWTAACYGLTAAGTAALGFVQSVGALLTLRSLAWAGRGFRSPLRDFLMADAVEPPKYGRAYGLERAGDMIGAVLGPLLAAGLLASGLALQNVLLWSLAPGALAASCILLLVRERSKASEATVGSREARARLPRGFWPLIVAILVFGLGDFSRSFLILAVARRVGGGADTALGALALGLPVLLYVAHNAVSALSTFPAGRLADRFGKKGVLGGGYALGLSANVALALGHGSLLGLGLCFLLSGVYIAVEETVEKALVAEILPREIRSFGLGVLATANAAGDMVSSLYVGVLWDHFGAATAFSLAAAFSALGCAAMLALAWGARK